MMERQDIEVVIQVEYGPGKTRRLYENRSAICQYNKLVAAIRSKIPSLTFVDIGLLYENPDKPDHWVVLSQDDREVEDIIHRAKQPEGTEYKLLCFKTFEGKSPATHNQNVISACKGKALERGPGMEPRQLFGTIDVGERNDPDGDLQENFVYSSPLDTEVKTHEEEVQKAEEDYLISVAEYNSLYDVLHPEVDEDPSLAVCSNCHTRAGHHKGQCPSKGDPCPSMKICGKDKFHNDELKELNKLKDQKGKKDQYLKRRRQMLKTTMERVESLQNTFKQKVQGLLINSNKKKYTKVIHDKVFVSWPAVNMDLAILEGHYKPQKRTPQEHEAADFDYIISEAEKLKDKCKRKD